MTSITMAEVRKIHKSESDGGHYFDRETTRALNSRFERAAYRTADGAWAVFVETTRRETILLGYLDGENTDHYNVCFLDALGTGNIRGNERRDEYPTLEAAKEAARASVATYDQINTKYQAHAIIPDPHNRAWYLWPGGFCSAVLGFRMADGLPFYGYTIESGPEGPDVETVKRSMRHRGHLFSYAATYDALKADGAQVLMPDHERRMWFAWHGGGSSYVHVHKMDGGQEFHIYSIFTEADALTPEEVKANMRQHMAEGYSSDL